jgi:hypothetical protein
MEPLSKKHAKQFMPAHREGLPVLLLLDQAEDGSEMTAQWLFTFDTLRNALARIFPTVDNPVREVWLRRPNGACLRIIPPEPEAFIDGLDYLWGNLSSESG